MAATPRIDTAGVVWNRAAGRGRRVGSDIDCAASRIANPKPREHEENNETEQRYQAKHEKTSSRQATRDHREPPNPEFMTINTKPAYRLTSTGIKVSNAGTLSISSNIGEIVHSKLANKKRNGGRFLTSVVNE